MNSIKEQELSNLIESFNRRHESKILSENNIKSMKYENSCIQKFAVENKLSECFSFKQHIERIRFNSHLTTRILS